jgi:hypothetical protein
MKITKLLIQIGFVLFWIFLGIFFCIAVYEAGKKGHFYDNYVGVFIQIGFQTAFILIALIGLVATIEGKAVEKTIQKMQS